MDVAVRVSDRAVEAVALIGMSQGYVRTGRPSPPSILDGRARIDTFMNVCKQGMAHPDLRVRERAVCYGLIVSSMPLR